MTNWHRLFGIGLIDLFAYTDYEVELEKDLSIKQQFLDVVIIEKVRMGKLPGDLPDGLDNLAQHNLLTYKSFRESLTSWALDELVGHYVNYRKQSSDKALLPVEQFRLYAVSTHFPQKLAKGTILTKVQAGVYEIKWGSQTVRVLVLNEFPETSNNAFWQLYSANPGKIKTARLNYRHKLAKMSSFISRLFEFYNMEGVVVAYTIDDYVKDYVQDHLDLLNPEDILQKFSTQERLTGLSSQDIVKNFPSEELLKNIPFEELLKNIPLEELEKYLAIIKKH